MNIQYQIQYSKRKTVNISVERDRTVIVRAPSSMSEAQISELIEMKKLWIYEKLNHPSKYPTPQRKRFISGESILYLGRNYKMILVDADTKEIVFRGKFFVPRNLKPYINVHFREWFTDKAKEKLIPLVKEFARSLGVRINSILISDLKYRWGSCTPKNNINLNWKIIQAPMFVIEYIIVHELTHLIEPNHTRMFWSLVSVQLPHYKKAKQWLKENGNILEIDF